MGTCVGDFATKNLHLVTIFYHLVANWRLNNFFDFEPCLIGHIHILGIGVELHVHEHVACTAMEAHSGKYH